MKGSVLVDTDVLVDYFRGNENAQKIIQKYEEKIVLSSIVIAELYAGVKGPRELSILDEVTTLFHVIPVSRDIARSAGFLKKEYGRSHGTGMSDALIAATALHENAELVTLNAKHFPMIKGLKPAYHKKQM